MLDLIVPGAGSVVSVLQSIYTMCNDMRESQKACERVHRRLADILTELQKSQQAPPNEALARYGEMLTSYAAYLTRYKNKPLYARLLQYQKMMDELRLLNEEIDTLLALLNIATNGAVMQWKNEWKEECEGVMTMLMQIASNSESVLSEVRGMREQLEALTVIRYELQQARLHRDTLTVAKTLYTELTRVSKASVEAIPTWFVPQLDLDYDPKPFARGSFGAIHRGTWRSGTNVVVKTLLLDDTSEQEAAVAKAQFDHEIELWHKFSHPNVVKMFGACHVTTPPFIVCEDAAHGNLASFFNEYGRDCMWGLLYDVALGLEYLHASHIVHGDLKLNNLLVGSDGAGRVADFGLSFLWDEASAGAMRPNGGLKWLAPECLESSGPTFASDVYALAMCIIEAVTGEPPFAYLDDTAICQQLRQGTLPPRPNGLPDEAWELVVAMATFDPSTRPKLSIVIAALKKLTQTHDRASIRAVLSRAPSKSKCLSRSFNEHTDVVELIAALKSDDEATRDLALKWLCRQADDEATAYAIKHADGYRWLVAACKYPGSTWRSRVYALGCLNRMRLSLAISKEDMGAAERTAPTPDDLAEALEAILHPERDEESTVEALERIRWVNGSVTKAMHEFLPPLVDLLRVGSVRLLEEATRTLRTFATDEAAAIVVVEKGAVPLLFNQLEVGTPRQKEQTAMTLGSIARFHNKAVQPALIRCLVKLACEGADSRRIIAAGAIEDIMETPANHRLLVEAGAIQPLVDLLAAQNENLAVVTANALVSILSLEATKQAVVAAGAVDRLIEIGRKENRAGKKAALAALGRLAWRSETRAQVICDAGGIRLAADLLREEGGGYRPSALYALKNLACTTHNQSAIAAAGAIVPMVDLLRSGTDVHKPYAAEALAALAHNHESNTRSIRASGVIPLVVGLFLGGIEDHKTPAARALLKMAQCPENVAAIIAAGAIPPLVELAKMDHDKLKALAIAALHQLGRTEELTSLDPINYLAIVERLRGRDEELRRYAAYALEKVAGISRIKCDEMAAAGAILPLVELVHAGMEKEQGLATSALLRLAHASDGNCRAIADAGIVTSLVRLVEDGIEGLSADAMLLVACIAGLDDGYRQTVANTGATQKLAQRLLDGTTRQRDAAARALKTFVSGSADNRKLVLDALMAQIRADSATEKESGLAALALLAIDEPTCSYLVTSGVVLQLVALASTDTGMHKTRTAILLRCLVACDEAHGDTIAKADGVAPLVQLMQSGTPEQRKDAAFVVGSLARHSTKRRLELVKLNAVSPLVDMARAGDEHQKTDAAFALGSLLKSTASQRELKKIGGLDALQTLAKSGTPAQAKAAQRAISIGSKCRVS